MSGTFGTPAPIPHQPVTVEMQTLDENGKAINVQINPQPMVTAETLQTFNKTFLNDLHQPEKSRIIRPVDNVKPKSIGGKILDALKAFGHAVYALIFGNQSKAEDIEISLEKHFDAFKEQLNKNLKIECNANEEKRKELKKNELEMRNIKMHPEEYKSIQEQIRTNFDKIKQCLPSMKNRKLLVDCLKFYKALARSLTIAECYYDAKQQLIDVQGRSRNFSLTEVKDIFNGKLMDKIHQGLKEKLEKLDSTLKHDWIPCENSTRSPFLKDQLKTLNSCNRKIWLPFLERLYPDTATEENKEKLQAKKKELKPLIDNWRCTVEKLTIKEKDGRRLPNKNLSKDDIESLKDAFAELSKACIPSKKSEKTFEKVMPRETYVQYTELYKDIMEAYAEQEDKEMSNFIKGNFECIVQKRMGKDHASSVLDRLKTIKKKSSSSASIELLQKLQLLEILLTLQTSPDSNKTFEELLSNDNILLKDEDCIFLVEYFKTLKGNTPNTPLAQKIRNLESNLPKYLREQSEQKVNFETNFLRRKRLSEAAKLYASDRKSNGILNMDIEQTRQNLQIDDLGDENVRNEIIDFLKLKDALDNEDENLLEELSTNENKDIQTAAKATLERLKQLEQQKKLRSNL